MTRKTYMWKSQLEKSRVFLPNSLKYSNTERTYHNFVALLNIRQQLRMLNHIFGLTYKYKTVEIK